MFLLKFLKRRSICQWLLIVIFVSVIGWLINFLILLNTSGSGHKHRKFMNSVAGYEPLELDFNGRVMHIPPDYIEKAIYKTRRITDKHTSYIIMTVRWPDFEPRSRLDGSDVAGEKGLALIKIQITAPSSGPPENDDTSQPQRPAKQSNLKRILSLWQWNTRQLNEIGLVKYVQISPNKNSGRGGWGTIIYVPINTAYKQPTGEDFFIACNEKYSHIGIPSGCKIHYRLKNQVALTYLINAEHLNNWRELDQGIRRLMTTFSGVEQ